MKKEDFFPDKYLKADDLGGSDLVLTISEVEAHTFDGEKRPKPILSFKEMDKQWTLNLTNFSTIEALYGEDTDSWPGKQIQVYPTTVTFRGQPTNAVRIRPTVPGPAEEPPAEAITDDPIPF